MAWICFELYNTLVEEAPSLPDVDPATQMPSDAGQEDTVVDPVVAPDAEMETVLAPVEGAVEVTNQLAQEGHRLTVFTIAFVPMPNDRHEKLKNDISELLTQLGFPMMEIWTGTTKPAADIFIGNNEVTYDGDWAMTLAIVQQMLEERGLGAQPVPDQGQLGPVEEQQSADEEAQLAGQEHQDEAPPPRNTAKRGRRS